MSGAGVGRGAGVRRGTWGGAGRGTGAAQARGGAGHGAALTTRSLVFSCSPKVFLWRRTPCATPAPEQCRPKLSKQIQMEAATAGLLLAETAQRAAAVQRVVASLDPAKDVLNSDANQRIGGRMLHFAVDGDDDDGWDATLALSTVQVNRKRLLDVGVDDSDEFMLGVVLLRQAIEIAELKARIVEANARIVEMER